MAQNRRKHIRTPYHATVALSHPSFGTVNVQTKDISEGGLAVDFGHHIPPPVGTVVDVIIKRYTGPINKEPLSMNVVYAHSDGMVGLAFK